MRIKFDFTAQPGTHFGVVQTLDETLNAIPGIDLGDKIDLGRLPNFNSGAGGRWADEMAAAGDAIVHLDGTWLAYEKR